MKKLLLTTALALVPVVAFAQTTTTAGFTSPTGAVNSATNPVFSTLTQTNGQSLNASKAATANGNSAGLNNMDWGLASGAAPSEQTTAGNSQPLVDAYGAAYADGEGLKPTYSAITSITVAATPTDVMQICGVASKVVRIRQISIQGLSTVAAGDYPVLLVKRSAANTAGTSSAVTQVPLDSGSAASTATVLAYTANPTITGVVGTVAQATIQFPLIAAAVNPTLFNFGSAITTGQSVVLRTAAECLGVNLAGVTLTGTVTTIVVGLQYTIE